MNDGIYSIGKVAEILEIPTRRLRYILDTVNPLSDRRLEVGNLQYRYFNNEDIRRLGELLEFLEDAEQEEDSL